MRVPKGLLIAAVVVTVILIAAWLALRQLPVSFGYGIRAEFEHLPENDKPFEEWMKSQPGVVERTVHVSRHGGSVGVMWIMVQTAGPREPPVPDFRAAFERFGYKDLRGIRYDWHGDGDWPNQKESGSAPAVSR